MTQTNKKSTVYILGAGPAGLSAAWWLTRQRKKFRLIEAADKPGGTCVTFQQNDWYYDSGAHRFHDRFDDITRQVKNLMGDNIRAVSAPSQIYENGKYFAFPIKLKDLLEKLSINQLCRMVFQVGMRRLFPPAAGQDFESFAVNRFGPDLANRFLLNYTTKLWGRPCSLLSNEIQGSRLKGLDLATFLRQMLPFSKSLKSRHLDGSFYYPDYGIGQLMDQIADQCGTSRILLNNRITRLETDHSKIKAITTDKGTFETTTNVINTLPLDETIKLLSPTPPDHILKAANQLAYRNLLLVAIFINKPSVTLNATVYFPDKNIPFTRVYEPRNRSKLMSPEGKTSLIAEIPVNANSDEWNQGDKQTAQCVIDCLESIGWIKPEQVLGFKVHRLERAYPILETTTLEPLQQCQDYITDITNMHMAGRNGLFAYTHIHTIMRQTQELVEQLKQDVSCAE